MSDRPADNTTVPDVPQPESASSGLPRKVAAGRIARVLAYGLLAAVMIVLTVATVAGFAAGQWWVAELASHLRVQLALGLVLCAAALAVLRAPAWAAVALVMGALNMLFLVPLYVPDSVSSRPGGRPLTILLANVHRANEDHAAFLSLVQGEGPDLVLVLEADGSWMSALEPLRATYPFVVSEERDNDFGLAVLSRVPLTSTQTILLGDLQLPAIATSVEMGDRTIHLLAAHAQPPVSREGADQRNVQLKGLANEARSRGEAVVLCGDLNVTPWSPWFGALLEAGGLVNAGRGHGWQPTWNARLPGILGIPIDHCLVTPDVGVRGVRRGPPIGSDHLPLIVNLAVYRR